MKPRKYHLADEDEALMEQLFRDRALALERWRRAREKIEKLEKEAASAWSEARSLSPAQVAEKFEVPFEAARRVSRRTERRTLKSS